MICVNWNLNLEQRRLQSDFFVVVIEQPHLNHPDASGIVLVRLCRSAPCCVALLLPVLTLSTKEGRI